MKNRTVYEVLDSVMQDYAYSIKKEGKRVEISGSVVIKKIGVTVSHEKTVIFKEESKVRPYGNGYVDDLERAIGLFKEELRNKVADVIREHKEELTDDDAMIKKLLEEVAYYKEKLEETEKELAEAKGKITTLELEKITSVPYPPYQPANPYPWQTGITWGTGDPDPNVVKQSTTSEANGAFVSSITTEEGLRRNGGAVHDTDANGFSLRASLNINPDCVIKPEEIEEYLSRHTLSEKLTGKLDHMPKGNWWEQIE